MKHLQHFVALILLAALVSSVAVAEGAQTYTFVGIPWGSDLPGTIDGLFTSAVLDPLQWIAASKEERQEELERLRSDRPDWGYVLYEGMGLMKGIWPEYVTSLSPEKFVHAGEFGSYLANLYPDRVYKDYGGYEPHLIQLSFLCRGDEEWLVAIHLAFNEDGDTAQRFDAICDTLAKEYDIPEDELDALRQNGYTTSNGTALELNKNATDLTMGLLDLKSLVGVDIFELK